MKKLFLLAIVVLGFTAVSFGQDATAVARGKIQAAYTLAHGANDLDFGIFTASTTGNTSTLRVYSDGTLPAMTGSATKLTNGWPANFTVGGANAGALYYVNLPTTVTLTNGSYNMSATNFSCNITGSEEVSDKSVQITKTLADMPFNVGATLTIGDAFSNPAGTYTSLNFTVTVSYN